MAGEQSIRKIITVRQTVYDSKQIITSRKANAANVVTVFQREVLLNGMRLLTVVARQLNVDIGDLVDTENNSDIQDTLSQYLTYEVLNEFSVYIHDTYGSVIHVYVQ